MRNSVTITVPLYNEEQVLPELLRRLTAVMAELENAGVQTTALLIDDGSHDKTRGILEEACRQDGRLGYLRFSRNFGHQAAVNAALDHASSDAIVIIDGDLQDPPELILKMINIWKAGEAEVVYGQRETREGNPLKRLCYAAFYRIFNAVVETKIPVDAGDFALMDRCVYSTLREFPERVRFLRGLRSWVGFRQVPLIYQRPDRFAGSPKYSFKDLYKLATDGIASFSVAPLRIAQFLAFVWFVGAFGAFGWILLTRPQAILDPVLAVLILLGFSMAMLFLCIYILGAYISRMYLETKRRPLYIAAHYSPGKSRDVTLNATPSPQSTDDSIR
jgi:glycosyltransferase involved in cell wall biosynthesis